MTEKTVVVHSAGQHAVAEHALLVEDALGIDGAERDATAFGAAVAVLAGRLANSAVAERVGRTIGLGFTGDRFADAADRLFGGVAFESLADTFVRASGVLVSSSIIIIY